MDIVKKPKTEIIIKCKNLLTSISNKSASSNNNNPQVDKIFSTYIKKHIKPLIKDEELKPKIFSDTESGNDDENDISNHTTDEKLKELNQNNSSKNSISSDMSEHLSRLSFSISKSSDMDGLLDNFSNKSDEVPEIEYKKITYEESVELMRKFNKNSFKALKNTRKGFDEEVKLLTEDFYNDLIVSHDPNKKKPIKKSISYIKVETLSGQAERMRKFKHDLSIKLKNRFRNVRQSNESDSIGKKSTMKSKNKRAESKILDQTTQTVEDEK